MTRKLKIKSHAGQPTLFDMPDLYGTSDTTEMPVHPSISEFVAEASNSISRPDDDLQPVMTEPTAKEEPLLFISFGSGSSGNSAYIGTRTEGILIDAGVDGGVIRDALHANGISRDAIKGICITHDHSDHVRYVYSLVRKHPSIGVYCTPKTLNGMLRRHNISRRIKDYHRPIYKEFPFEIAGIELTAFDVSHDGTDNAGFFIRRDALCFAIATDLGCITPRVDFYMRQAQHIMIESNYDAGMLMTGSYPQYLKSRIMAERGHLDNEITASFLASCFKPELRNIFLCHLSQDNNTPEIASQTVRNALSKAGATSIGDGSESIDARNCAIQLVALPRYGASRLFILR